ncbi:hypothetical protein IT401_00680 [Candidatus Nomurabacteria bacterium]|nr:hypothetical protein [Candidatus Nomurabacteria bacterium]
MSNILSYTQKKYITRIRVLRMAIATASALVLLGGIVLLLMLPLLVTINSRFSLAENQISLLEREGSLARPEDVDALTARIEALSQKLAAPLPASPTEAITTVREAEVPGIILTGFSFETSSPALEVAGTAATREALQQFVTALESHSRIAMVDSPVSNYVQSTKGTFTVTVTFISTQP